MNLLTRTALFAATLLACDCAPHLVRKPDRVAITTPDLKTPTSQPLKWEVHFSPRGGCTEQTVRYINQAQKSVYLQAYSFTSKPIADALVAKKAAGLEVDTILDRSDVTERGTLLPDMLAGKVPTYIDKKHAIAHNKVVIIDEHIVLTGSFNFTNAAETSNAENCLALDDVGLAGSYLENWKAHQAHSDLQAP